MQDICPMQVIYMIHSVVFDYLDLICYCCSGSSFPRSHHRYWWQNKRCSSYRQRGERCGRNGGLLFWCYEHSRYRSFISFQLLLITCLLPKFSLQSNKKLCPRICKEDNSDSIAVIPLCFCFHSQDLYKVYITGYKLPWEESTLSYPNNFASPLNVIIEASYGASDYGNKYGQWLSLV